ncbi:hypothetical protein DMENIID0001_140390 [Sergentomyia squamirostris]
MVNRFLHDLKLNWKGLEFLRSDDLLRIFDGSYELKTQFQVRLGQFLKNCSQQKNQALVDLDIVDVRQPQPQSGATACTDPLSQTIPLILSSTFKGKKLLEKYENKNEKLIAVDQSELVKCISEYYLERDINLGTRHYRHIATEIGKTFPAEEELTYYVPQHDNVRPKGILQDKFKNMRKKWISLGLIKKLYIERPSKKAKILEQQVLTAEETSSLEAKKKWLQSHFEPAEEVKTAWRTTIPLRFNEQRYYSKNIVEFIAEWPVFATSLSHDLLNIDFDVKFKERDAAGDWNHLCQYVFQRMEITEDTYNSENKDSRDIACMLALHHILVPTLQKGIDGKKKFTILDSQNSQVLFIAAQNNLDPAIDVRAKLGRIQPLLIVEGNRINPKVFTSFVDRKCQKFDTFMDGIDYLCKIFFMFNLEFPKESILVWTFLQTFLLGLKSARKVPKILDLLKAVNSTNPTIPT